MAIKDTLNQRSTTHGDYTVHARITQELKRVIERQDNYDRLNDCQREALAIIAHKIARILAGNPNFHDHWHDIAGYATLVADRIVVSPVPPPLTAMPLEAEAYRPGTPEDGGHHARHPLPPDLYSDEVFDGMSPQKKA
jgi:hypothetical protein